MHSKRPIRGNTIFVIAGLIFGCQSHGCRIVIRGAVKILLRCIFGRGEKIVASEVVIPMQHLNDVKITSDRAFGLHSISRNDVKLPPSVALADPRKRIARLRPVHGIILDIHPCLFLLCHDRSHVACSYVRHQDIDRILKSICALNRELISVASPFHSWKVKIFTCIARDIDPFRCTT